MENGTNGGSPPGFRLCALTGDQVALIRSTFHALDPTPQIADRFYEILFEIAPDLRALFRPDMSGQGMRFMSTLAVIVQHLDQPEELAPYVERLAQGHAAYGVRPEHFQPMGVALIRTMQEALGPDFPPGAAEAWTAAYARLAGEMIVQMRG